MYQHRLPIKTGESNTVLVQEAGHGWDRREARRAALLIGAGHELGDLYRLEDREQELISLERMAEKSASNVLEELNSTRAMTFSTFISALGLPRIGPEIATLVCAEVKTLEELIQMTEERQAAIQRLVSIDRVGETVANLLLDGISDRKESIIDLYGQVEIVEGEQDPSMAPFPALPSALQAL